MKENNIINLNINGNNIAHLACARGSAKTISYLIKKNPELLHKHNLNGDTCVHLLAQYGYFKLLKKYLKENPESVNLINNKGDNVLFLTINNPKKETPMTQSPVLIGSGEDSETPENSGSSEKNSTDNSTSSKEPAAIAKQQEPTLKQNILKQLTQYSQSGES